LHYESYQISLHVMANSNLRGAHRPQKRTRLRSHGDVAATSLMVDVHVTVRDGRGLKIRDKKKKKGYEENERM